MTDKGEELVVLSHGMLGYGFPERSIETAIGIGVDLISVDAGSSDPGPYYLGSGELFGNEGMVRRDLDLLLEAQAATGAKIVIGSAGGAGCAAQLQRTEELLAEAIARRGKPLRVATIASDIDKDLLRAALKQDRVRTYETGDDLTEQAIEEATNIVAQIGIEPIAAALSANPDIVLCGRAWDPGNIAAYPVSLGYDRGLAIHAGKILECGAQAALPVEGSDLLLGRLRRNDFIVEALQGHKRCTVDSVGAHTLYEKTDPVFLPGPGGKSDLSNTRFEQFDERRVRVEGSRFIKDETYRVKLEGAKLAGYRSVAVAGIRDPRMIAQIDKIQADLDARARGLLAGRVGPDDYKIAFHRYGKDGVMGKLEPVKTDPHEIGLVIDVVARTQQLASQVMATYRALLLHWGYDGRKATAGNLAFPFSPAEFNAGALYEFNIYHLLELDDAVSPFPYAMKVIQ